MKCPLGCSHVHRPPQCVVTSGGATIQDQGGMDMSRVQYVGMDVDKEKIVLARLAAGSSKDCVEQVITNTPSAVKKYFLALLAGACACDFS